MREPATHSIASELHGSGQAPSGQDKETLTHPLKIELERLITFEVHDNVDEKIGSVSGYWTDQSGRPAFIGVKTLWLPGNSQVVPAWGAVIDFPRKQVLLPFTKASVQNAPSCDPQAELDAEKEQAILEYYRSQQPGLPSTEPPLSGPATPESRPGAKE